MNYSFWADVCGVMIAVGFASFIVCLIVAAVLETIMGKEAGKQEQLPEHEKDPQRVKKLKKARNITAIAALSGLVLGAVMIYVNHKLTVEAGAERVAEAFNSGIESDLNEFYDEYRTSAPLNTTPQVATNSYPSIVDESNPAEQAPQSDEAKVQEKVLYNDNNILVISKSLLDTRTGGKELEIYIENTSASDYYIHAENVCINDYQVVVSGTWLSLSGKKLNDSIEIYASQLSENNITEIDKIEFSLRFGNSETDDEFYSDVIVLEY